MKHAPQFSWTSLALLAIAASMTAAIVGHGSCPGAQLQLQQDQPADANHRAECMLSVSDLEQH